MPPVSLAALPSTPAALGSIPGAVLLQEGLWGAPALDGEDEEDFGVRWGMSWGWHRPHRSPGEGLSGDTVAAPQPCGIPPASGGPHPSFGATGASSLPSPSEGHAARAESSPCVWAMLPRSPSSRGAPAPSALPKAIRSPLISLRSCEQILET